MVNEKMISSLVKRFSHFNVPIEDLRAEATYLAVAAADSFDPMKGKTLFEWQWGCIFNGLKKMTIKENTWKSVKMNIEFGQIYTEKLKNDWLEDNPTIEELARTKTNTLSGFETMQSLSKEAQEVCKAILSAPSEYLSLMPKIARGKIMRKLRKDGWKEAVIWKVFRELKRAV